MSTPFAGLSVAPFGRAFPRGRDPFDGEAGPFEPASKMRRFSNALDAYGPNYEDEDTAMEFGNATISVGAMISGLRTYGERRSIYAPIMDGELVFHLRPDGAEFVDAAMRNGLRSEVALHALNTILATDVAYITHYIADNNALDGPAVASLIRRLGVMMTRLAGAEADSVLHTGSYRAETAMTAPARPKASTLTVSGEARVRNLWPKAQGGTRLFLRLCPVPKTNAGDGVKHVAEKIDPVVPHAATDIRNYAWQLVPWCEVKPRGVDERKHRPDPTASCMYGGLTTGSFMDENNVPQPWTGVLMYVGTMLTYEEKPVHRIHASLVDKYCHSCVMRPVDEPDGSTMKFVSESMAAGVELPLCTIALGNPAL